MPFCKNCGEKIEENVKFCSECGHTTAEGASTQTGVVPFTKGGLISILAIIAVVCCSFVLLILFSSSTNIWGVTIYLLEGGEVSISLMSMFIAIILNILIIFYVQSEKSTPPSSVKRIDSLPVKPKLEKCPTCGYDIMMIGEVQKCTACGFSSKIEAS